MKLISKDPDAILCPGPTHLLYIGRQKPRKQKTFPNLIDAEKQS